MAKEFRSLDPLEETGNIDIKSQDAIGPWGLSLVQVFSDFFASRILSPNQTSSQYIRWIKEQSWFGCTGDRRLQGLLVAALVPPFQGQPEQWHRTLQLW